MADQMKSDSVSTSSNDPAFKAALDGLRDELMAMPEALVERKPLLDASAAAVVAEASANKLVSFRAALVAQFGEKAGTLVDELRRVARATRQADIELAATARTTDLSVLHELVRTEYALLVTDADSLAHRNVIDPQRLEAARDIQGYEAIIRSLLVLVSVLRERWAQIEGRTPLTPADLDRAEAAAQKMSAALGDRDNGVTRAPALELRTRALSKLIHHYEELRRMVSFLRWHQEDEDAITPSLWAGRSRRTRSEDVAEAGEDGTDAADVAPPVAPATPSPINGGGPFNA